jgi:hypothetical protein
MGKYDIGKDIVIGSAVGTGLGAGITGGVTKGKATGSDYGGMAAGVIGGEAYEAIIKKVFEKRLVALEAKIGSKLALTSTVKAGGAIAAKSAVKAGLAAGKALMVTAGKTAAKMALKLAGGPVGLAMMLLDVISALLDNLWNPWKNYFNKDLIEMSAELNTESLDVYKSMGVEYPTIIVPNIIPEADDEKGNQQISDDMLKYYQDRGLITPEEAKRQKAKAFQDFTEYNKKMESIDKASQQYIQGLYDAMMTQKSDETSALKQDIADANYEKKKMTIDMNNSILSTIVDKNIQDEKTQLLLSTVILYKKGLIKQQKETSFFNKLVRDIKKYVEVYWLRIIVWTLSFFSIISVISSSLAITI